MEEKYRVIIRGIRPLLMHKYNIERRKEAKKAGTEYNDESYAEGCLYKNKNIICEPSSHIEGAMIKAAASLIIEGRGKKTYKDLVKGGIFVEPLLISHKYQEWKMDLQPVVVQRARIVRARPRFDKWELEFIIINIEEKLKQPIIKQILMEAGKHYGIGDYRPRYGTFEIIKFEKIE